MPQRFTYRAGLKLTSNQIYCGRPNGYFPNARYGNPFVIGIHGNRDEVIQKHKDWVKLHPDFMRDIKNSLRGKDLGCYCKLTEKCHCDFYLELANS